METFHFLLNRYPELIAVFAVFAVVAIFALRQRKQAFAKIDASLKMQKEALKLQNMSNQQLNTMVQELRRANRILSTIAEMDSYEEYPREAYREPNADASQGSSTKPVSVDQQSQSLQPAEGEGFKLYVGNIDYAASEGELASYFSQAGLVEFVNIPVNRYTGKARGFGFVSFSSKEDADRAMTLHGTEFKGRQIQVNFAKERDYA